VSGLAQRTGRGEPELTKLSLMRRAMVRHMVAGAAVPCFYLRATADVTALVAMRRDLKAEGRERVPSVNDFVVRAAGLELRRHPAVNSSYGEDAIAVHERVNVGVAVAVPDGLVVSAIYDADEKGLDDIAAAAREVADLAARRKLGRDLLADATFTVSNLGMYGIEDFDPILNPPQAAILAVGAAIAGDGATLRMRLTLGCDHRVLTGAEAAPFLIGVRDRLAAPAALL
jgi:pyruvate dehydrogenase E2 component (dihydrolipoamide acetyltransferase)